MQRFEFSLARRGKMAAALAVLSFAWSGAPLRAQSNHDAFDKILGYDNNRQETASHNYLERTGNEDTYGDSQQPGSPDYYNQGYPNQNSPNYQYRSTTNGNGYQSNPNGYLQSGAVQNGTVQNGAGSGQQPYNSTNNNSRAYNRRNNGTAQNQSGSTTDWQNQNSRQQWVNGHNTAQPNQDRGSAWNTDNANSDLSQGSSENQTSQRSRAYSSDQSRTRRNDNLNDSSQANYQSGQNQWPNNRYQANRSTTSTPGYRNGAYNQNNASQYNQNQPGYSPNRQNQAGANQRQAGNQGAYIDEFAFSEADFRTTARLSAGPRGKAFLGVQLDRNQAQEAHVTQVYPNSPAAQAGLRPGDTVLAVNGQPINSPEELTSRISQLSPGANVHLIVDRTEAGAARYQLNNGDTNSSDQPQRSNRSNWNDQSSNSRSTDSSRSTDASRDNYGAED